VLVTEQYPKGPGVTVPDLAINLPEGSTRVEDRVFSLCRSAAHPSAGSACGMEAHVCVLQNEVYVVTDAVCSRGAANYSNALARLQTSGIVVTNTESMIFEWLRDAPHEHFSGGFEADPLSTATGPVRRGDGSATETAAAAPWPVTATGGSRTTAGPLSSASASPRPSLAGISGHAWDRLYRPEPRRRAA